MLWGYALAMDGRGAAQGTGRAERQVAGAPYLSLIDGVRGIAALSVLFYHYVHFFMAGADRKKVPGYAELFPGREVLWPAYDFGNYAVQIFWLISGFVFAHVYYGHSASTRSFFVNRFARLYPLHLLTLLVVALLQGVALMRFGYTPLYGNYDWPHFAAQLVMAADWVRTGLSFNGPVWSVSVEIAVYALFWLSRRPVERFGLPLLLAMSVGFYVLDVQLGLHTRIFACGMLFFTGCALFMLRETRWGAGWRLALLAAVLVGVGLAGSLVWGRWGWRVLGIPGIFGGLFLLLAAAEGRAPRMLSRACEWLGENTYGIYLWHVPVQLCLLLVLMPAIAPQDIAQNGWFLALYAALVIVVARVSYVWFERPMRDRVRRRFGSPPKVPKPAP
ncbi:MAG: Acyltransferase 3 [Proteobacteria bacterium]|nr:Acyltransferase 3 [Pseudomonadota bacterium]